MRLLIIINLLLLLLFINSYTIAGEKIWKHDADINNPKNWLTNPYDPQCKGGVKFAEENRAPIFIDTLYTSQITLPQYGDLRFFENGFIEFYEKQRKCIQLKPLNYYDWYNPENWKNRDENPAVPHNERVPCHNDFIIIPGGLHSRISIDYQENIEIQLKTLQFGNKNFTNTNLRSLFESEIGSKIFMTRYNHYPIEIVSGNEEDFGQICHEGSVLCWKLEEEEKKECLEPVNPEGFCFPICGAYLTFTPRNGFRLKNFRKKLKKFASYTWASLVNDPLLGGNVVQVVFTEQKFTEQSLTEAKQFYEEIKNDDQLGNLILTLSGLYYIEGSSGSFTKIFGPLFAVILVFGIIFFIYSEQGEEFIQIRLAGVRDTSLINRLFSARFDNRDEQLIIDSQSLGGSVLSLEHSFDNPMFGRREEPNSASTSTLSTIAADEKPMKSEVTHENPLYDIAKNHGAEE